MFWVVLLKFKLPVHVQYNNSVRTLLSSSHSLTSHDLFHDLFMFSKALGLATSVKNSKPLFVLEHFLTLNSSTDTNSGVHQNACHLRCLTISLYLTSSWPCISAVNNLSNRTLIFHDFQGPTIKFHDFPGLEMEFVNSMTFQVFHDLYES